MIYQLENSDQVLVGVHEKTACRGWACTVHNKTDHHMRSMPQNWRTDIHMMERVCEHGIGHPDPDEPWVRLKDSVHSCDGCCHVPVVEL